MNTGKLFFKRKMVTYEYHRFMKVSGRRGVGGRRLDEGDIYYLIIQSNLIAG